MDDLAAALTESMSKDGQTPTTAVIPFANGLKTDTIVEDTSDTGVTVDGVLLKDGRFDTAKGSDIASATTTDIGAATGNYVDITGTTTITGLGTITAGRYRAVQFDGALTLTHNASSLILPGGANITTAAGDTAGFVSLGSGNWKCLWYTKADGTAVVDNSAPVAGTGIAVSGSTVSADPNNATDTAIAADDEITFSDTSDSNNPKKDTVQGILDLVPSSGKIVQVVNTMVSSVATGTTTIPADDTIPQNTEGNEFMTLAITPTSATNKLEIDVTILLSLAGGAGRHIAALFQDSTADALAAVEERHSSGSEIETLTFKHYMTAGTTSPTTFKVRGGNGNAGTVTFNGASGTRRFGGVAASSITIREIEV